MQPQQYERTTDFTERDGDDTNHSALNEELDAAALSINQVRDNLELIQRDDGALQNGIVTADALDPSAFDAVQASVNAATQEAQDAATSALVSATTANNAKDAALAAKTSAETARDASLLNATGASNSAAAALASQTASAASEASALSSKNAAAASQTAAAASQTAAANSATTATAQAGTATTKAGEAAASATASANSAALSNTKANEASASADSALTSKNAAAASASSAASSQASATASASTATAQASIATSKAAEAAASEAAALTSKNAAAASQTAAAASETAAAGSATSASGSASTATTQAGISTTKASEAAASAVSAANSAAAAATALDNFDDRYLGQKTADPTLDNDGNALVTGALYFNSSTGKMRVYTGTGWIDASSASVATLAVFDYVATAGQSTFSGNDANGVNLTYTVGALVVSLNGSVLKRTDYTASTGSSIVLGVAANAGDELTVYAFGNFQVADTYSQAAADAKFVAKSDPMGFKNRIINGAMMIDQRNAGAAVTVNSAAITYSVDRFYGYGVATAGVFTLNRSTQAANNFVNSLAVSCATADTSITATKRYFIGQAVEGVNIADLGWGTASAQPITVSFWVQSALTGTYCVAITNTNGDRSYIAEYTINNSGTWEYKSVTIPGDTTGTWVTDNSVGMSLRFALAIGSTYQTSAGSWTAGNYSATSNQVNFMSSNTSRVLRITGVQLEKGSTATSFDYRPYGTELALCQRYFETSYELGTAVGAATYNGSTFFQVSSTTTTLFNSQRPFAVTKRATPTMVYYNPATGTSGQIRDMSSNANYTVSSNFNSATTSTGAVVTSASVTANYQYGAHWTASSEL